MRANFTRDVGHSSSSKYLLRITNKIKFTLMYTRCLVKKQRGIKATPSDKHVRNAKYITSSHVPSLIVPLEIICRNELKKGDESFERANISLVVLSFRGAETSESPSQYSSPDGSLFQPENKGCSKLFSDSVIPRRESSKEILTSIPFFLFSVKNFYTSIDRYECKDKIRDPKSIVLERRIKRSAYEKQNIFVFPLVQGKKEHALINTAQINVSANEK